MAMSNTVRGYLREQQLNFDTVVHSRTFRAEDSAYAAGLLPSQLAKAVVVQSKDDGAYVMALIPAGNNLQLRWLNRLFDRAFNLVDEAELALLFPDCDYGAVPGFGQAYNVSLAWDLRLEYEPRVYLEGGDHCSLIGLSHGQFMALFGANASAPISTSAHWFDELQRKQISVPTTVVTKAAVTSTTTTSTTTH